MKDKDGNFKLGGIVHGKTFEPDGFWRDAATTANIPEDLFINNNDKMKDSSNLDCIFFKPVCIHDKEEIKKGCFKNEIKKQNERNTRN